MKFNKKINDFFDKHIKLNDKRIEKSDSICSPDNGTLTTFLLNNTNEITSFAYQGSRSYHTLIKPHPDQDDGRYDIDLAVKIKYNEEREGNEQEYYNLVYNCLNNSDRYKEKVSNEKERAVRVEYDSDNGEFYVDLVPMFKKENKWYVVDSKLNQKEISGSFLFRDWVNEQNNKTSIEGSQEKFLKKVIQIYKFFRNEGHISTVKSVQLTLLLSRQVDKIATDNFTDISSTLYHISVELKEELTNCENIDDLDLSNPCLPEEVFSRCFKGEDDFNEFKDSILEHVDKIIDAYEEQDEEKSLELWQGVFGDGFEQEEINKFVLVSFNHAQKPSDLGYRYHTEKQKINIECKTKWKHSKSNKRLGYKIKKHGKKLSPSTEIIFYTTNVPANVRGKLLWQVTNNSGAIQKRGEIHGPYNNLGYLEKFAGQRINGYTIREVAKYSGKHYVKCRLANDQNVIIAESDEFYIDVI